MGLRGLSAAHACCTGGHLAYRIIIMPRCSDVILKPHSRIDESFGPGQGNGVSRLKANPQDIVICCCCYCCRTTRSSASCCPNTPVSKAGGYHRRPRLHLARLLMSRTGCLLDRDGSPPIDAHVTTPPLQLSNVSDAHGHIIASNRRAPLLGTTPMMHSRVSTRSEPIFGTTT